MTLSLPDSLQAAGLSRRSSLMATDPPISTLIAQALAEPGLISLAAGFVDRNTLPTERVREASLAILADAERSRTALQYGTTAGFAPLRAAVVERLARADRSIPERAMERALLTAGSNHLLQLVVEALFDEGDVVLCAAPTYLVFLSTAAGVGAITWGIETDAEGMIPEALQEALEGFRQRGELDRVKAIYCVSYFDNPQGVDTSPRRREAIFELAERYSTGQTIYVIDDLAYRDLRYAGTDTPSFAALDPQGRRVISAGTFSKSFAPGVRVGWGLMPDPLARAVERIKGNVDFGSPHWNQVLMHQVLTSGAHDEHAEVLRQTYRTKRDAMLAALEISFQGMPGVSWIEPAGGLYVWLTLPESVDAGPSGRLLTEAIRRGVLYVPGEYAFAAQGAPVRHHTIRLSYGVQEPAAIAEGIAALAAAVKVAAEQESVD